MKRSWKTSLGGILTALAAGLTQKPDALGEWTQPVAGILAIVGPLLIGMSARDNNVSSEDAGAKPKPGGP